MSKQYDFSGWATKNDLKCSDGRTIRKNAFKDCDGITVPLVWNHDHTEAFNVLGHAELENRPEGVYTYGYLNDTEMGRHAKELIRHGDITSLSIYANKLQQVGGNVMHGMIREVSLVLSPANPGARITDVIEHSDIMEDYDDGDAYIECGDAPEIYHAEEPPVKKETESEDENNGGNKKMAEKTLKDIIDTMTDEQKEAMYTVVGLALDRGTDNDDEETDMKHNVFDNDNEENTLSHAEMSEIIADGKRYGSLKESFLQHGIDNIETLFPDNQSLTNTPDFYKRDTDWVTTVMRGVHHTPFSHIKSTYADITADEARAKGYTKGNKKVDEVIAVLKRTTNPTTIYKKQKLDRDDVIDITDFDVISWLKGEMRFMLDEELARAFLVGDGRNASSDDKINETAIRPIWTDDDVYTIKQLVTVAANATEDVKAKSIIRAAVKARKDYKGSGSNMIFFTTEDYLTSMLLMEDTTGRIIYDSVDKLATAMRVKRIITVPVMEGLTRTVGSDTRDLVGIIVDLADYNVGADKGGAVNMFDDFDIDYNAQKYLIETRCSGALTKPKSAIAIEMMTSAT